MTNAKTHAATYFCIGGTLFGFSFLADGWSNGSLITLAILFWLSSSLLALSLRFKPHWLLKITEHMGNIRWGHLVIFFVLCGLGITLIQNNQVFPGIISVSAGYFILARGIGLTLGREVIGPVLNNRNRDS